MEQTQPNSGNVEIAAAAAAAIDAADEGNAGDPPGPEQGANPSKSAGGKLTEKRMAELWNSSAGPKYFLLRGGFDVGRGMDMARLQILTNNKAHITEQAAAQISTLWACKTEHFFPTLAPGAVPTAMPA